VRELVVVVEEDLEGTGAEIIEGDYVKYET